MKHLLVILLLVVELYAYGQNKNLFLTIGSTGIGAGYEQKINTKWSATTSLSYLHLSPSLFLKRGAYQHRLKGTAKFTQLTVAGKWYPNAKSTSYGQTNNNKFFIKGGVLVRDNGKYLLQSDYQKTRSGNQFDNADPESGKINFNLKTNSIQPFLAIGFELINNDNSWCATIEGGLSYHGTSPTVPFVNFYETGKLKIYEPKFNNWTRVTNLIELAKVYPLLNFTIGKRF